MAADMERVRRLYELPRYQEELKAIARAEVSREFCGHTLEHFLDVARLMYIRSLEEGEIVNREVIYAAALLHDLGRGMQYREGIPHQEAGVLLARELAAGLPV
ncbi:MAG: HD domain-containing protein [Lachnospiraceae bacterium]